MEELKPCPFCGKAAYVKENSSSAGRYPSLTEWWVAGCEQCGICFRGGSQKELAISFWNTRAPKRESGEAESLRRVMESGSIQVAKDNKELKQALDHVSSQLSSVIDERNSLRESAGSWQPIETAPRDGTPFLAAMGAKYLIEGIARDMCRVVHWCRFHGEFAAWQDGIDNSDILGWMPLPSKPTTQIEGGKP